MNWHVLWQNTKSSSFYSSVRIVYYKEASDLTKFQITLTQNDINAFVPREHKIGTKTTFTLFSVHMIIVDGNVCNSAAGTSCAMRCYNCCCKLTIKDFNALDKMLQHEVNQSALSFGLSTLDACIRFYKCILHLPYKLAIKKCK